MNEGGMSVVWTGPGPVQVSNAPPKQVAAVVTLKFMSRGRGNITVPRVLVCVTLNLYRNRLAFSLEA